MAYATARDGTKLFYKDWGAGKPVVLIHGWPLTGDTFDDVAIALAEDGFRSIVPDRRGFGRSGQPWSGNDYDTYADDVEAILEDAGIHEPAALVGFSMGGGEVARFLSRKGADRAWAAVLISSVVPFMLKTDDNPDGVDQSVFDGMTAEMKKDHAEFFRGFFKDFFGMGWIEKPVSEGVLHDAWRQSMMAGLHNILQAAKAFATTDFRPDLKAFTVPTLIIHGTADKTVPIDATAKKVSREVQGSTLIEYDGDAHGVFASNKERLIGDLRAFLVRARDETKAEIPLGERA